MSLAKEYAETEPIGVYVMSNFGGLVVLDIKYGIDDSVVTCFDFGNGRKNFSESKIQYTKPRSEKKDSRVYFIKLNRRYYLDEIMRTNL